ncbi:MAG: PspC domain-containing protein [Bacteroidales bacterium]|nr:PspC domain-containing protein [Bacteroidales bacterium]
MAKRLYRNRHDKMVAGVCSGLGEYFDIDPTIIRLAWVLFCFLAGGGVIAYLVGMIVIPYGPDVQ